MDNPNGLLRTQFDITKHSYCSAITIIFGRGKLGFHLWCNGQWVGYSQIARLPVSLILSPFSLRAKTVFCAMVIRWSDGSFIFGRPRLVVLKRYFFGMWSLLTKPANYIRDVVLLARLRCLLPRATLNINTVLFQLALTCIGAILKKSHCPLLQVLMVTLPICGPKRKHNTNASIEKGGMGDCCFFHHIRIQTRKSGGWKHRLLCCVGESADDKVMFVDVEGTEYWPLGKLHLLLALCVNAVNTANSGVSNTNSPTNGHRD